MKKLSVLLVVMALALATLAGCGGDKQMNTVGTAIDGNEATIEKAAIRLGQAVEEGKYKLVSTEELNQWITEGKEMIIIDTMPADSFAKGHIPGAVNAELPKTTMADVTAEQKDAFVALLGADKNATIVTYCGFVACERSHLGAIIANELGYTNVYRCPGGSVGWGNAGFTVEK